MTTSIQNMIAALVILETEAVRRNRSIDYLNALTVARTALEIAVHALEIAVQVGEGAAR